MSPFDGTARTTSVGDLTQVHGRARLEPALAPGQRQQRLDQPLLLLAGGEHAPARLAQRLDRRVGVAERDLDERALERDRRPQLVRRVRDEPALGLERRLEPAEQPVERVAELLELVVGAVEREALVQVALGDPPGASAHRPHRAQRSPGTSQPSPIDASAMIPSARPDRVSSVSSCDVADRVRYGRRLLLLRSQLQLPGRWSAA